jgi:hypothetical protein
MSSGMTTATTLSAATVHVMTIAFARTLRVRRRAYRRSRRVSVLA